MPTGIYKRGLPKIKCVCLVCGKIRYETKSHVVKTCSSICQMKIRIRGRNKKRKKIIDKHGYYLLFDPHHPLARKNGYVSEHRVIWYKHNGYLPPTMSIHHINGDKKDNRIKNLKALTKTAHHHIHNLGKKHPNPSSPCKICGKVIPNLKGFCKKCYKRLWARAKYKNITLDEYLLGITDQEALSRLTKSQQ